MLRMSFMEHLEELRNRIIRALYGLGIAFVLSLGFANKLWDFVSDPAVDALKHLNVNPPRLAQLTPMEGVLRHLGGTPVACFRISRLTLDRLSGLGFHLSRPLQERTRLALPFVLLTAGLFIAGGCFAYFLAFRYGLEFLLGIGMTNNVQPVVSITEYFDLFVNVTLGVALVFELPVLIFLLTLLRLLSPRFLLRHSRYAILAIVIAAAIITPTPDVFNLMLFAIPMCAAVLRRRLRRAGLSDAPRGPHGAVAHLRLDCAEPAAHRRRHRLCDSTFSYTFHAQMALPHEVGF